MSFSQFDERVLNVFTNEYDNTTTATIHAILTGTTFGTRIDQMIFSWSGAASILVNVIVTDGGTNIGRLGTVTVPAAIAGVLGSVDVIATLLPAIQPYIMLNSTLVLAFEPQAAITGADLLDLYVSGGDF